MNALIVYDSQFGNTEQLAKAMAQTLGEYGIARAVRVNDVTPQALAGLDLLMLGSPTQRWQATPAMQTFIAQRTPNELRGLIVACFDTRAHLWWWLTGSAARQMYKLMQKFNVTLLRPESFFVTNTKGPLEEGEVKRAVQWAQMALDRCVAEEMLAHAA